MNKILLKRICTLEICILFIVLNSREAQTTPVHSRPQYLQCIPDFRFYYIRAAYDSRVNLCASVFRHEVSWDSASAACTINFSYLTERIYLNSSIHVELLNNGIDVIWVGIRRRAHFFVRNSTELFEEKENVWGFHWSTGEPRRSDCVALNLTSGSLFTHNCKDRMSFVCENRGTSDLYETSLPHISCPENWILSYPLAFSGRKCVSSVNEARSQIDAERECDQHLGRLASMPEYDILHANYYLPTTPDDTAYWINKEGYESSECPFKIIPAVNGSSTGERPRNCSRPLQFICVKDFEIKDVDVDVGKSGINTNQTFPRTSSCLIEDILTCNINIRDEDLGVPQIFRWYKDDIPIPSCTSNTCKVGFTKAALKWDRYAYMEETRQGSYHCEVSFAGLIKTFSSHKTDIFFSDVATYVIDIKGVDPNSFFDYSHHNFERSMKDLNRTIFTSFLEKLDIRTVWDLQSISVSGRSATVKTLLYIHRKDVKEFDDEAVYYKIKKIIKDFHSEDAFLTVNSADVCFSHEEKSNDTCPSSLKWPTTRQAKNVVSSALCLDEYMKPVYRECKASLVSKAEWSPFNCSSCRNMYERFQELPLQCPKEYIKSQKGNVCFKIFKEKRNWTDAQKQCSESSSYMLNEPFADIGVNEIWLSFKYSHGKIQDAGMKLMNLKLENVNVRSHELECVSAVLVNNVYELQMSNCSKKLSFVCVQNPYESVSSVKFLHTWRKLPTMESCYYFSKNVSYTWRESIDACKRTFYGADILQKAGIQDVKTYTNLKKLINQEFEDITCRPFAWWMNYTHEDWLVSNIRYVDWSPYINSDVVDTHGSITLYPDKKIYWTLDSPDSNLKLACEIQKCEDNRPTQAYIEDRTRLDGIHLLDHRSYLKNFKLKCVPSGWFITNSMRWYKGGVLLDHHSNELTTLNISRKLLFQYQDYYSCSVDQYSPLQTVHSSQYLLKIPGVHTFALSMVSRNKTYLSECPKYMFQESFDKVSLRTCFHRNFNGVLQDANFLLRNLTCNKTHVAITIHVYLTSKEEEEILFKRLKNTNFFNFSQTCDIDPNVSVKSTVACYSETKKLKNSYVTWPSTPIGKIAFPEQMCLTDEGVLLERRCVGDFNSGAVWSGIFAEECSNLKSDITKELNHMRNEMIAKSYESLSNLPNLTATPKELKPVDVQIIGQIFENLADQESLASEKLNIVVETMSNLIDAKPEVFTVAENSSNRIIENFEHITSVVNVEDRNISVATENIIVDIHPLNTGTDAVPNCKLLSNGVTKSLFNASATDLHDTSGDLEAGIVLPSSLINGNLNATDRLVYAVYKKNFIQLKNVKALSFLIHASLPNIPVYDLGKEEVTLFFKLYEKIDVSDNSTPKCVFWDPSLNSWSYKGCFAKEITENSVLCICNHLTSFSVVMEIDATPISPRQKVILQIITYIGCSLSCIGYCLIIITFTCFREWRKSVKNKAMFNYSVSQFVFLLIFMVGINQTNSRGFCKAAAILSHYFLLSSFAWMVVLAFTVYLSLVKVLDTYIPCLIQKFITFAWGVPAVILVITLSFNHEYYSREDYCWLSKDVNVYGIIIPLAVMLIINFITFGIIFHVNICRRSYLRINQDRRKLVIARAKALFCTSILLGLSWIFGFLAIGEAKLTFEYLFSITTPLQGFLLAIFFVIRSKPTRDFWLRFFRPSYTPKSSSSHTNNSIIVTQRVDNGRKSRYENMINSVMYRAHSPYTPYI